MKKQSSIDWLVEQLRMQNPLYTKEQIIEMAKEMEKQQIIDAYRDAITYGIFDEDAEQYYTETFTN
jgi:HEPN domain-containing protein